MKTKDIRQNMESLLSEEGREHAETIISELAKKFGKMKKRLKKTERRLGKAQIEVDDLADTSARRKNWLRKAKKEAGYEDKVSFDIVWNEVLAKSRHDDDDYPTDRETLRSKTVEREKSRDLFISRIAEFLINEHVDLVNEIQEAGGDEIKAEHIAENIDMRLFREPGDAWKSDVRRRIMASIFGTCA